METSKVILLILDGWGIGDKSKADAIFCANTPYIDRLYRNYPNSKLFAHGKYVGLPDDQMGNSEVGHSNIGAGRVLFQDLVRINTDISSGYFSENKALTEAFTYAQTNSKAVHLMGLVSDGGVHSYNKHLYSILEILMNYKIDNVFVHAITDGRDTDPMSGIDYLDQLSRKLSATKGSIGSVIGRYYAMDRDKRWERVKEAYDLYVNGKGYQTNDVLASVKSSYASGITDEFIKPIVVTGNDGAPIAKINEGDVVFCFNYRADRVREITTALTQRDIVEYDMHTIPLHYLTMTNYDETFKGINVLYQNEDVKNTLGEVLASNKLRQLRIAETEKYPHVTFFFSGGRELPFANETRIFVNSPKVATYDLQPSMSAFEITEKVFAEIEQGSYDFICLNFANCDMVGHTGVYNAILEAVETVDKCVEKIIETAMPLGYTVIVTADHGNSDMAINNDGSPNTEHSLNQVPCIIINNDSFHMNDGVLADIAPTILDIMGIEKPKEMTGKSLISR